jgi:hypothetical protein
MPFNDEECILEPQKNALFYWDALSATWKEWQGHVGLGTLAVPEIPSATDGVAAVNYDLTRAYAWQLDAFEIHLSAAGTAGNLTITKNSYISALTTYDTVLLTLDMTAIVNYYWQPARPIILYAGDQLEVDWANASTRTYGLQLHTSRRY